jgi:transposase-like protein
MSGFAFAVASCVGCNRLFSFNPASVPSVSLDGQQQPVCRSCVERINRNRARHHLPKIEPLPGTYEPLSEETSP